MTIASMTGFARTAARDGAFALAWELKSVNAKGFDARLRLPPGFDSIEIEARRRIAARLTRGTVHANLSAQRDQLAANVRVNHALLERLAAAVGAVELSGNLAPARLDGLLLVRGVLETLDDAETEGAVESAASSALRSLDAALDALVAMRLGEGAALASILGARLTRIAELTKAAEANPGRQPDAVRDRLQKMIASLCEKTEFDPARLHQEAVLLAARADIKEELDRLKAHVAAARDLLEKGGPVGRRLDFLSQELSREANTLCAKSNDHELTATGLELKVEIEQLREQIQNIE